MMTSKKVAIEIFKRTGTGYRLISLGGRVTWEVLPDINLETSFILLSRFFSMSISASCFFLPCNKLNENDSVSQYIEILNQKDSQVEHREG
jgi:hypothetical protein